MSSVSPPLSVGRAHAPSPHAEAVRAAVGVASRAPSIHNTQPWHWHLTEDVLDLRADLSRQLDVADPDGHSLLISCGAATQLTQIALAAQGWIFDTSLMPESTDPDLLARFRLLSLGEPDREAQQQSVAAGSRRSDRRVYGPAPVAAQVIERLRGAAEAEAVYAHFPVREDESLDLAVAISRADRSERDDPAYAAEMAAWVRSDSSSPDGVPTSVIPAVPEGRPRHTDVPLRDFELGIPGSQLITPDTDERPLIAVIFTEGDDSRERLRAGQSMMRLMIQAELEGVASCPLSQSVDLLSFRSQLRTLMSWTGYPQMMLRLGQKPDSAAAPLTARRAIEDVLSISPDHRPSTDGRLALPREVWR
jgi:nitroreductase